MKKDMIERSGYQPREELEMGNKPPRIYLDMDGVLADFITGVADLIGEPDRGTFGDHVPTGYDLESSFGEGIWERISSSAPFWSRLGLYIWADPWIEYIRANQRVVLCTSPSIDPGCAAGKTRWIQAQLGTWFRRYVIVPAQLKHLLCHEGDILIDDSEVNIDLWEVAGGVGYLWPMPWNREHRLPGNIDMRVIKEILREGIREGSAG